MKMTTIMKRKKYIRKELKEASKKYCTCDRVSSLVRSLIGIYEC